MTRDEELRDIEARLKLLHQASRPNEPLDESARPTAQGHILSAISQLERRRGFLLLVGH